MRPVSGAWTDRGIHEMQHLGFNYRLTDVQSALGTSQLRRLPGFIARRREIAARYLAELRGLLGSDLPVVLPGAEHSWHLFVVRVSEATRRRAFFEAMTQRDLGVQVHYLPVYRHPYYEDMGYPEGLCPSAEDLYRRAVPHSAVPGHE